MKEKIFIGSSSESLEISHSIQEVLQHYFYITPWSQGVFKPSTTTLNSLLSILRESDYGIFVFSPDDISIIRSRKMKAVRDNVIFEMGLFVGQLGIEKCFYVIPSNQNDLSLPSDLIGIMPLKYDPTHPNIIASVGPACSQIRRAIEEQKAPRVIRHVHGGMESTNDVSKDNSENIEKLKFILNSGFLKIGNEDVSLLKILLSLSDYLNQGFRPGTGVYDIVFASVWRALSDSNSPLKAKLRQLERFSRNYSKYIKEIHELEHEISEEHEVDTKRLMSSLLAVGVAIRIDEGEMGGGIHFMMSDIGNEVVKREMFSF